MGENARRTGCQSKIATGTGLACRQVFPLENMCKTTKTTGAAAADRPRVLVVGVPTGTQNHVLGNNRRTTSNGQTPASSGIAGDTATASYMLYERCRSSSSSSQGLPGQCFPGSWLKKIFSARAVQNTLAGAGNTSRCSGNRRFTGVYDFRIRGKN